MYSQFTIIRRQKSADGVSRVWQPKRQTPNQIGPMAKTRSYQGGMGDYGGHYDGISRPRHAANKATKDTLEKAAVMVTVQKAAAAVMSTLPGSGENHRSAHYIMLSCFVWTMQVIVLRMIVIFDLKLLTMEKDAV